MDSFKRIKEFAHHLSVLAFKEPELSYDGIFSLSLTPEGISYAYIKHNKEIFELQEVNTIACSMADLKIVLVDLVNKYNLEKAACSWLLTPDKYQLIQIEELPVPPEEFQAA